MTMLAVSRGATLLWVILPYLAIATFVVGHIWRWRRDQFTWTTRSTQLLESKLLKIGGPLFHLGLLVVIGGSRARDPRPGVGHGVARRLRGHLPRRLGRSWGRSPVS